MLINSFNSLLPFSLFPLQSNEMNNDDADLVLTEELPIRLAHRVKELDGLPYDLNKMPSIEKVKRWYAESFEVCSFSPSFLPFLSGIDDGFFDLLWYRRN